MCSDWRSFISASQHLNVRRGQELKIGSAFLITAPAERDDLSGLEPNVVAVAFRHDVADIVQIHDIAVVAAKEDCFRELLQNIGYLSCFSKDLMLAMEDQVTVIGLNKMTAGIMESMKPVFRRQPEDGF